MFEQGHQGLQGNTGVDQGGGVGVTQLVWGGVRQTGAASNAGHDVAELIDGQVPAMVGEQEIGGPCGARVWQRPPG
jgi:hypothetical protein